MTVQSYDQQRIAIPGRVDLWQAVKQLRAAFCRDTSELPKLWNLGDTLATPGARSIGQCHVASLVLKNLYGGMILEGHANGDVLHDWQLHQPHYWWLIDGMEIDITRDQYTVGVEFCHIRFAKPPNETTREKSALLAQLAGLTA